ncbi:MAG: alanyl-tRNA editing protein [Anaerolineae bacterium]
MKTTRLYYVDPYLREFTAHIVAQTAIGGRPALALDRTAFYPTGGGQPHDTGLLKTADGRSTEVVEVTAEDGLVWHVVKAPLDGEAVHGLVNWDRRFDHMQQHTGQHILSQAFIQTCQAETVAFHLGANYSTIDLNRTDLEPQALAAAEAAANAVVDNALPVTAAFVSPAELAHLPLRKPPKVNEDIRVVQVAGYDWSACGGTHVANSAQVGLIKIVAAERRGPELRVTFLCGRRARGDYARLKALAQGLVARFTTAEDEILHAVDRRMAEMEALRKELADLERQWAEALAEAWWAEAQPLADGRRLAIHVLDGAVERAKRVAQALRGRPGAIVLFGVRGERPQLLFTRADDVALDAGALLRQAAAVAGGRGGGRPDWAQGGVPTNEDLAVALEAARKQLSSP